MNKLIPTCLAALTPGLLLAGDPLPVPVHQWTFDTDGTDSAGGNTMLLTGTSSQDPAFSRSGGGSIRLDPALGADGAVTTDPVDWPSFANGDVRTICFWMKAPAGQVANATMFGAGVNQFGQRFDIRTQGDNLRVEIQGAGQPTTTPVADLVWRHVAVVVPVDEAVLGDTLFYVDGVNVPNANTQAQAMNTASGVVRLGDSVIVGANREYAGWLDDVRIYDVALDETQIAAVIAAADAGGASASGFTTDDDQLILGESATLSWDAFALDGSTLTITNDQDGSTIDAAALTSGTVGSTTVSPASTTVYTLNLDNTPVGTTTITVKNTPDLLTFTGAPELIYGTGNATLSWTTASANRLEITNDQDASVITYTFGTDGAEVLDAGSVVVGPISTTTTYTLTGWLDEGGAGESTSITATITVQAGPDVDMVAIPSIFSGPQDVTLNFNATVIFENTAVLQDGVIDDFPDVNGFVVGDFDEDFDALLGAPVAGTYFLEALSGSPETVDAPVEITTWSGNTLTLAEPLGLDFQWQGEYNIVTQAATGADMVVISDGSSDIFTTTDPAVIANGSFVVSGVNTDTTFTITASISGAGSTMASVSVDADGTGASYEETIIADGPVGYYPFNEGPTGAIFYDYSGNGNHGTEVIGNLTQGVPAAIGTAHRFNDNETLTTGVSLDPSLETGFSMEALIRPDSASSTSNKHILANTDGAGTGRSALYLRPSGQVTSFLGNSTTASAAQALDESWSHLVMTMSPNELTADWEARTYLDGVLVDTVVMTNPPESADGLWRVGSHKSRQANNFWNGLLDEIAIYDYVLSETQVAAHNAAFLNNAVGALAFQRSARVLRNEPFDLFVKVGGGSSSAVIDNGVGIITPGTASTVTVTPGEDTTYTLDVDGETTSVTLQVVDPLVVTDVGTDNGDGVPFVSVSGITPGIYYQLFVSENLQGFTPVGQPFLGVETTETFLDPLGFDSNVRPQRFYDVRDVADPPVPTP